MAQHKKEKEQRRSSKHYSEQQPCDNKGFFLKWVGKEETTNKAHQSFSKQKGAPVFVVTREGFFNSIFKKTHSDIGPVIRGFFRGQRRVEIRRKKEYILSLIGIFLLL